MSVLVKGLDMPKSCSDCVMRSCSIFTDHNTCMALKKDIWNLCVLVERLEDCPLVEIPTPHGRAIDADELEPDAEWSERQDDYIAYSKAQIRNAPTIIEAEKE